MHPSRFALPRLLTIGGLLVTLTGTLFAGSVASPTAASASAVASAVTADHAADWARSRKGSPYDYGANGPHSFDCSGLTRWVYARVGMSLPHSSAAQANKVKRVKRSHARRGDLVFFYNSSGSVFHVGIYAGHGNVWHAPYSGTHVRRDHIWTTQVFFGRVR
jgi:cell wall-associated NlpC family hydrolase